MNTIVSRLLYHAELQPEAPAFIEHGRSVSYAMLARQSAAAADWLHHAGVRAGDTVALSLAVSPEASLRTLWMFYALARLGAVILPFYPDVPPSRRAELAALFKARWHLAGASGAAPGGAPRIDAAQFEPAGDAVTCGTAPRGDDPAAPSLYHFTSGTTGTPKVCLLSAAQLVTWRQFVAEAYGSSASDRKVSPRAWPEMVAARWLLSMHAVGGAYVNADVPRTREQLAALVRDSGVTELVLTPFQLRVILRSPEPHDAQPITLRVLSIGGGFVSPEEIRQARSTLTPNFFVSYATNEVGPIALLGPRDPVGVAGCVGRVSPGIEVEAVDENDRPLPPGATGILRLRVSWMPHGYVGNAQASAERFRQGWFYPGDSGSIDAHSYLTVIGRTDEVINFGGLKIAPSDVEAVLMQHPEVADCAVAGVPDAMSGQKPVAFVVLRQDVAATELHRFCADRMDSSRAPFSFFFLERIERSPEGKVLRERLRDVYRRSADDATMRPDAAP